MLLFLTSAAFAQRDLEAIQKLDQELPNYDQYKQSEEELHLSRQNRRASPPQRIIRLEEIRQSPLLYGAIPEGKILHDIVSNHGQKVTRLLYVRYHALEDEHQFKYIQNQDGSVTWKIASIDLESIQEDLSLQPSPTRYTPAPTNLVKAEFDKKLNLLPELNFYAGVVRGDYIRDLLDNANARNGTTTQYGLHYFTQWKLPLKVGAVVNYERTIYNFGNETVIFSSPSLGPQIRTRDFTLWDHPLRLQGHFRVSPLAKAVSTGPQGSTTFKFNSADLIISVGRPIKNIFGEFVLGIFFQSQWLHLKEQNTLVNLAPSSETNKSFGVTLSQVFE